MLVDSYGGVQDFSFIQAESENSFVRERIEILLSKLAGQARSIMDLGDLGVRLRVVRSTFDDLITIAFPLATREVLVVALESREPLSIGITKLAELLRTLDAQSPIETQEIWNSLRMETGTVRLHQDSSHHLALPPHQRLQREEPEQLRTSISSPLSNSVLHNDERPFSVVSMPANRRPRQVRSQDAIDCAILEACRTPLVQHWVMVKARVGYDTFWSHMKALLERGFLREIREGSRTLYTITEGGLIFLSEEKTGRMF